MRTLWASLQLNDSHLARYFQTMETLVNDVRLLPKRAVLLVIPWTLIGILVGRSVTFFNRDIFRSRAFFPVPKDL